MKRKYSVLITSLFLFSFWCSAQAVKNTSAITEIVLTDSETKKEHCSPSDNLKWVVGIKECLKIITLNKNNSVHQDTLVVYLHGDGSRAVRPSDYLKHVATKIKKDNAIHVVLMRPGYYDSSGYSSTGISHRKSRRGTSYNSHNVEEIAFAIKSLKAHHKISKTILVGHSGGAAISALILGLHPGLIDGAILAACPCNVNRWVEMANKKAGKGALSPHEYVGEITQNVTIIAITGTKDKVTSPLLASEYIEGITNTNVSKKFISVNGESHYGITRSDQFFQAINELLN